MTGQATAYVQDFLFPDIRLALYVQTILTPGKYLQYPSYTNLFENLNKLVYEGYRKYLPADHYLWGQDYITSFNGMSDHREMSTQPNQSFWKEQWRRTKLHRKHPCYVPIKKSGINQLSSFYRLPYFKSLLLPHLLDPMHVEKDVVVSLMKTLSNAKGTKVHGHGVRLDLRLTNKMSNLWDYESKYKDPKTGAPKYRYSKPPWMWTNEEYISVTTIISKMKTPTTYGSSMARKFSKDKIVGMKTHNWHNMLHDYLAVAI